MNVPRCPRHSTYRSTCSTCKTIGRIATCDEHRRYFPGCSGCQEKVRRHDKLVKLGYIEGRVDSIGSIRRLRALSCLGWTQIALAKELGMERAHVHRLQHGKVRKVQWRTRKHIADVYSKLCMTPCHGSGPHHARRMAQRNAWHPPLAWDDIDDPDEVPVGPSSPSKFIDVVEVDLLVAGRPSGNANRRERLKAIGYLADCGYSDPRIAEITKLTAQTVLRARTELGIRSRWSA